MDKQLVTKMGYLQPRVPPPRLSGWIGIGKRGVLAWVRLKWTLSMERHRDAQERARDHAHSKPERASPLALLVGRFPHPGMGPPSHL